MSNNSDEKINNIVCKLQDVLLDIGELMDPVDQIVVFWTLLKRVSDTGVVDPVMTTVCTNAMIEIFTQEFFRIDPAEGMNYARRCAKKALAKRLDELFGYANNNHPVA